LVRYYKLHVLKEGQKNARPLPSAEQAEIACEKWSTFFGPAVIADLRPAKQEAFIEHLRNQGLSDGYISRVLSVGRAALRFAWKRGELASVPFIMDVPKGPPRDRRLSMDEARALLIEAKTVPHLFTYCMLALNTLGRPEAILDLAPWQIDLEARLIHLNPRGRRQTKKYRPVVPITNTVLPFVSNLTAARIVNWHGKPIDSIKKGFRAIVRRAGLSPDVTPYVLRHTMATELRRRGVPAWEVQGFLGHKVDPVTEVYAKFDPTYLSLGAKAIDAYFTELFPVRKTQNTRTFQAGAPRANRHNARMTNTQDADLRVSRVLVAGGPSRKSLIRVVGATGIEPVTPTMST
jgi:integrase